jgi:hypothetical protein
MSKNKNTFSEEALRAFVREASIAGGVAGYTGPLGGDENPGIERQDSGLDPEDMVELIGFEMEDKELPIKANAEDPVYSKKIEKAHRKTNFDFPIKSYNRPVVEEDKQFFNSLKNELENIFEARGQINVDDTDTILRSEEEEMEKLRQKALSPQKYMQENKTALQIDDSDRDLISNILKAYEDRKSKRFRDELKSDINFQKNLEDLEKQIRPAMLAYVRAYHNYIVHNNLFDIFHITSNFNKAEFFKLLAHDEEVLFKEKEIKAKRGRPSKEARAAAVAAAIEKDRLAALGLDEKEWKSFDQFFKEENPENKTLNDQYQEIGAKVLAISEKIYSTKTKRAEKKKTKTKKEETELKTNIATLEQIREALGVSLGSAVNYFQRAVGKVVLHVNITREVEDLSAVLSGASSLARKKEKRDELVDEIIVSISDVYGQDRVQNARETANNQTKELIDDLIDSNDLIDEDIEDDENKKEALESHMALLSTLNSFLTSQANLSTSEEELLKDTVKIIFGLRNKTIIKHFLKTTNDLTLLRSIIDNDKEHFIKTIRENIREIENLINTAAELSPSDKQEIQSLIRKINSNLQTIADYEKKLLLSIQYKLSAAKLTQIIADEKTNGVDRSPEKIILLTKVLKPNELNAYENILKTNHSLKQQIKVIQDRSKNAAAVSKKIHKLQTDKSYLTGKFSMFLNDFSFIKAAAAMNPLISGSSLFIDNILSNNAEDFLEAHESIIKIIGPEITDLTMIKKILSSHNERAVLHFLQINPVINDHQNLTLMFNLLNDAKFLSEFMKTNIAPEFVNRLKLTIVHANKSDIESFSIEKIMSSFLKLARFTPQRETVLRNKIIKIFELFLRIVDDNQKLITIFNQIYISSADITSTDYKVAILVAIAEHFDFSNYLLSDGETFRHNSFGNVAYDRIMSFAIKEKTTIGRATGANVKDILFRGLLANPTIPRKIKEYVRIVATGHELSLSLPLDEQED